MRKGEERPILAHSTSGLALPSLSNLQSSRSACRYCIGASTDQLSSDRSLDHLVVLPGELAQEFCLTDMIGVVEIEEKSVLGNRYRALAERDLPRQDCNVALPQCRRYAFLPLLQHSQQ